MKPLTVADVRTAVAREWRRFIRLLPAPTDSKGWQARTRCQGWSVADLAVHAVWGVSMEADALHRARRGVTAAAEGRTIDAATVRPEDILAELRAALRALLDELAAVAERDGDRIVPLPYGQLPLALFLPILVMEAGIHTDDLAAAVRPAAPDAPLPDDVVLAGTAFLATFLPVLAAAANETPPAGTVVALRGATVDLRLSFGDGGWSTGTIDDASGVIEADDDSTVVRFALGRLRADDPRLAVSGFPGLEHAFKRWFPGP